MEKKTLFVLIVILCAGFFLRTYKLSSESIWLDESVSIRESQKDSISIISFIDPTPPLYYLLLHFWVNIFGISAYAVRMLSVFFGTLCIYLVFLVGKNLQNTKTGIVASLLVAVSPIQIYISQEARAYALFFTLMLLSMLLYLQFEKKGSYQVAYLCINILMVYAHLYGFLVLIAQNLHRFPKLSRQWIVCQVVIFLSIIPWSLRLPQVFAGQYISWITRPTLYTLLELFYNLVSGIVYSMVGIILAILALWQLIYIKRPKKILALWIIVPVLVPVIISMVFPFFVPKYAFLVSFPLMLLLSQQLKKNSVLLVIFIVLLSASAIIQQQSRIKDPWEEVALRTSQRPLFINGYDNLPYQYACGCNVSAVRSLDEIKNINESSFWIIFAHEQYVEYYDDAITYLAQNYRETDEEVWITTRRTDATSRFFSQIIDKEKDLIIRAKYYER